MNSSSSDDDFDAPSHSLSTQVATWIEQVCLLSTRVALPGIVVIGGAFLFYVVAGALATITGMWTPQFPFLSLTADPYFAILGFLAGLTVCVKTGAIITLYLMRGVETTRSQIATLAAFIGFGFGASVIRITLPTVVRLLIGG